MSKENWFKPALLKVGDRVSYCNVNQWFARGTLVDKNRGQHGGDCHVKWDRYQSEGLVVEECLSELVGWKESA